MPYMYKTNTIYIEPQSLNDYNHNAHMRKYITQQRLIFISILAYMNEKMSPTKGNTYKCFNSFSNVFKI